MGVLIIIVIIVGVIYFSNKASEAEKQRQNKENAKRKQEEKAFFEELSKLSQQLQKKIEHEYNVIAIAYPNGLEKWKRLHPYSSKEEIVSNKDQIAKYENEEQFSRAIAHTIEREQNRVYTFNGTKIIVNNTQETIDNSNLKFEEEKRREQEESKQNAELTKYKPDRDEIVKVLQNNGIRYFYHFTARENLTSIKKYGGLYSWYSMQENKRNIPCSGGDNWSHQLDMRHGLQDYVRLSFCDDHPMAFRLKQSGTPLVLLKIDIEVATWKDTQFSDINAADNSHRHGGGLVDLNRVNFSAVRKHYVRKEDDDFKPHQAEVMVKTFIPTKYILNLESPISL